MRDLKVEVVAADRQVWSGEASIVIARTPDGELGVMAGHEPVLAALVMGPVTVRTTDGGEPIVAVVDRGFLSISEDEVTILADTAQLADEIDVAAVEAELAEAQDDDARRWAEARLSLARR